MSKKARIALSLKLTQQVKSIINLEIIPGNIATDVFLEAVYLAYQQHEY